MSADLLLTIFGVAVGGTLLVIWLLRPYASESARSPLSVTVDQLGGFTYRGLILSSILGLYLELLLIRWISSEIRIFAYFKNFVLIACFLGFGLGCYLGRRAITLLSLIAPLLFLTLLIELPWPPLRLLVRALPVLLGATSEVQIWGVGTMQLTAQAFSGLLLAAIVALPLFALLAVAFIPVGQLVGFYLEAARNGIVAYSVNVLASLAGIALYTGLCFLYQPPVTWFVVAAGLALATFWGAGGLRWVVAVGFLACIVLVAVGHDEPGATYWSPYQKLNLQPLVLRGETAGYELRTNSSWFQKIIDLSPRFVAAHPELFRKIPLALNAFNVPYLIVPHPRSVLILGGGMGNDAAAALRNGAQNVTAVEIDPLIVKLGRRLHPERPYLDPRVKVVIDDARSYIQNTPDRFDLIVFSALDSHTLSSHFSNIRIDNYVYTREALTASKKLLAPNGIFVVRFQVQRPWIAGRLHAVMVDVFGYEPLLVDTPSDIYATGGTFFIAGSIPTIREAVARPFLGSYLRSQKPLRMQDAPVATDDWPYFYQRDPGLPTSVVTISVLLLVVCFLAARGVGLGFGSLRYEFFFLGAGFMLLEAQIVSRMALLFGTTWIVNSIVISVLLLLIVAANGVAAAFPRLPAGAGYIGILASIVVGYVLPLRVFFFQSFALKVIVSTFVLCMPVFFAGIVFIRRFAAAGFAAPAIGSNLLGSLAGGIAESLSLWLGLRSLLVIAAVFYGAAWLASRRTRPAPVLAPDPA